MINWRKVQGDGYPADGTACLVWAPFPGVMKIAIYRANGIEPWDGCFTWAPTEYVPLSELR